jgi:SHS2 domain-containing protein
MTDLRAVRPTEERTVSARAPDSTALVVAFLNELLLLSETDGFIGRTIEARPRGNPPTAVSATVRGERFDPGRHPSGTEVKAVTLHGLRFDPRIGRARVIVDL